MSAPTNETYAKLAIPEKSGMMNKKVRLNMIDKLQEKTLYDGQSEYYRNLQ